MPTYVYLCTLCGDKEIKQSIEGLALGQIDIVVGTHKLLSESVKYRDLGLLVIDEEHRFGVKHKETLKALRAEVDVLTLTATPIPRTLGMALEGLRDLSVIATAPQRRLAIKTFVRTEGTGVFLVASPTHVPRPLIATIRNFGRIHENPLLLTIHVGMAMLSYGIFAFAFAAGVAYLLQGDTDRFRWLPPAKRLDLVAFRAVTVAELKATLRREPGGSAVSGLD